jgi:hypothetical protein
VTPFQVRFNPGKTCSSITLKKPVILTLVDELTAVISYSPQAVASINAILGL